MARIYPVRWHETIIASQPDAPPPVIPPPPVRPATTTCVCCNRAVNVSDLDGDGKCCFCSGNPIWREGHDKKAGRRVPHDVQGWFWHEAEVLDLLMTLRPEYAVEVGTWLGRSAIPQAWALEEWGGKLICVDTWRGGPDLIRLPELADIIPRSYEICQQNLKRYGCENVDLWKMTSLEGAARYRASGLPAPRAIYIDADHSLVACRADLPAWWDVLAPGGVMFGDDFGTPDFPGVTLAWLAFAREIGQELPEPTGMTLPVLFKPEA